MAWQEKPLGFFTDTSICIGCKACEVACKEWNELPGNAAKFTADSFDNTGQLDAQNWRHVQFIEHVPDNTGMVVTPSRTSGSRRSRPPDIRRRSCTAAMTRCTAGSTRSSC